MNRSPLKSLRHAEAKLVLSLILGLGLNIQDWTERMLLFLVRLRNLA